MSAQFIVDSQRLGKGAQKLFLITFVLYCAIPSILLIIPSPRIDELGLDVSIFSAYLFISLTSFVVYIGIKLGFGNKTKNVVFQFNHKLFFIAFPIAISGILVLSLNEDMTIKFLETSYNDRMDGHLETSIPYSIAAYALIGLANIGYSVTMGASPTVFTFSSRALAILSTLFLSLTGSRSLALASIGMPLLVLLSKKRWYTNIVFVTALLYLVTVLLGFLRGFSVLNVLNYATNLPALDYLHPAQHEYITNFLNYSRLISGHYSVNAINSICTYPTLSILQALVMKTEVLSLCLSKLYGMGGEGLGFGFTPELHLVAVLGGVSGMIVHCFAVFIFFFAFSKLVVSEQTLPKKFRAVTLYVGVFAFSNCLFYLFRTDLATIYRSTSVFAAVFTLLAFSINLRASPASLSSNAAM